MISDTVRVIVHDTTLVRDIIVRVAPPESVTDHTPSWVALGITAAAAIVAGLAAQWFRVWLDRRETKRHLTQQLDHDLGFMGWLLEELRKEHDKHGGLPWQILSELDFILASYRSYQGQLTVLPWNVRESAARAFLDVTGVRETINLISKRNHEALAGHGTPVPPDEVKSAYDTFPSLRKLCRDAEVAARAEYAAQARFGLWLRRRGWLGWWFIWRQLRRADREAKIGAALDELFMYRQTGKLPFGNLYDDNLETPSTNAGEESK